MKFAHLSDTHFRRDYSGSGMENIFAALGHPGQRIISALQDICRQTVDFVLFTGDLVHEGSAEDYRILRNMLEDNLPGVPVIPVLGNHDVKPAFFKGYLGETPQESYCAVHEINGLRLVALDSAISGQQHGGLTYQQELFLSQVLRAPAPCGTLLVLHHPFLGSNPAFEMRLSPAVGALLRSSDVLGIFCGHTHSNHFFKVAGIPQFTAGSVAFSLKTSGKEMLYTDCACYNTYKLDRGKLSMRCEAVWPESRAHIAVDMVKFIRSLENIR